MKTTACLWFGCRYILQPFLICLGFIIGGPFARVDAYAQKIQYASKVLKYSSDLGGKINSINRILGKPNAFPQGGENANTWAPKDANLPGFVELAFAEAQMVKQIAIFENLNAGAVNKVMLGDGNGKYKTVDKKASGIVLWTQKLARKGDAQRAYYFNRKRRKIELADVVDQNPDITYILLDEAMPDIKSIRIEFNFPSIKGRKQIDAVAISDSEELIVPEIDTLSYQTALKTPQVLLSTQTVETGFSTLFLAGDYLYFTEFREDKSGATFKYHIPTATNPINLTQQLGFKNPYLNLFLGYSPITQEVILGDVLKLGRNSVNGFYLYKLEGDQLNYLRPLTVTAYNNYGDYSDMYLSTDASQLLIGMESDQTQGGFDIYRSLRKEDGNFGIIENIGKHINSAGDEISPFLLSDQKTLLFSANAYSGFGDFDLYVSTRLDDTWKNWSSPKNLGSLVNSSSFEFSPVYDEQNQVLYYISNQQGRNVIKRVALALADLQNSK
ncbi:MAG: hypothetical protein EOO99_07555 [Pedobacter sp.]|nr:MAG: hypothetical protein EOO99_07555 [Pedobacter sp.]